MKVLITGSGGFFGSWLIPGLRSKGFELVAYDLKDGFDILDVPQLVEALSGCDAVVHLAAYPHFKQEIGAQDFERRNIIGTAKVCQAMSQAGVRNLVYASSGAIYGFGPDRPSEGWVTAPITEERLPAREEWALIDAYGGSKLACEEWLQAVCTCDMRITALRINCIEPHHMGAVVGAHWGWWCSQSLATDAFAASLRRETGGFVAVNVGQSNPNLDSTRLDALLAGVL